MFSTGHSGGLWSEEQKLLASDGAMNAQFGYAVAVGEKSIVIGARLDDNEKGTDAGEMIFLLTYFNN